MGTTAEKFNYAFGTKDLLKTEINKINNVLDDNSTFRSYPQELFNGYLDVLNNGTDTLWNNLEKVSASGEEATLENVETAPIKMVLNGNTSQETTSGKNLIAPNNLTETTVSGVTFTPIYEGKELKYINVNGTSTSLISYDVSTIPLTLQAGTYFLSGCPTGGGNSTYELGLRYASFPRDLGNGVVLNLSAEATYSNCRIVIQNGVTVNNQKFYPMLEKSSTATSYEPYTGGIPSPNPDYPQEVKVVKGENVVSVSGKNMFDKDNATIIQGYFDYSHTSITSASSNRTTYLKVKPNTTYSVSKLRAVRNWIGTAQEIPTINTQVSNISNFGGVSVYDGITRVNATITTGANDNYIVLNYTNTNIETGEIPITILNSIQIEENSQATPFVPYSKTDYPLSLGTLELCKIGNYKDFPFKAINGNEYYDTLTEEQKNALNYGSWYVHKEINKVVFDGSESWTLSSLGAGRFYLEISPIFKMISGTARGIKPYSSHFVGKDNSLDFENGKVVLMTSSYGGTTHYFARFENDNTPTLSEWKTWLSNNNVTLYYVLATPTDTEITNTTLIEQLEAISKAKSVKDKTYITQTNDDLPFILDVEAIKEYEVN